MFIDYLVVIIDYLVVIIDYLVVIIDYLWILTIITNPYEIGRAHV